MGLQALHWAEDGFTTVLHFAACIAPLLFDRAKAKETMASKAVARPRTMCGRFMLVVFNVKRSEGMVKRSKEHCQGDAPFRKILIDLSFYG